MHPNDPQTVTLISITKQFYNATANAINQAKVRLSCNSPAAYKRRKRLQHERKGEKNAQSDTDGWVYRRNT